MKRMTLFIVALVLGIAVGGFLALRYTRRAPDTVSRPVTTISPVGPQAMQPVDAFQGSIKLDTKSIYAPALQADPQLREKLRRSEAKQRPQEGRN